MNPRLCRLFFTTTILCATGFGCRRAVDEITLSNPSAVTDMAPAAPAQSDWPWWRGPQRNGKSIGPPAPIRWSETENVLWKIQVPGLGHASPVIWGEHLFLATGKEQEETVALLSYERETGQQNWSRVVHRGALMHLHGDNSHASPTPACDGEKVYMTLAAEDTVWVVAVDFEGEVVWKTKAAPFRSMYGYGASPILYQSLVIVSGDSDHSGMVAALHRKTGKLLWRTARKNEDSYGTPILATINDQPQVIINGQKTVIAYSPQNGEELWRAPGPSGSTANTVAWEGDLVFATGGYRGKGVFAIRAGQGEVVWRKSINTYVPSPLAHQGRVFVVTDNGVAYCFDASSGAEHWKKRLGGGVYSSPVLSGDHVYVLNRSGTTYVLKAASEYELVSKNTVDDQTGSASPVICDGRIYLRTHHRLYCIGE